MSRWKIPVFWLALGLVVILLVVLASWGYSQRPSETDHQLAAAQQALAAGQFLQAAEAFAMAAESAPNQPGLWAQAGTAALQGGDPQAAIAYLTRIPQPSAQDQFLLGQAYQQGGDLAKAISAYQQSASVQAYTALWQIHQSQRDYPAVKADLQALLMSVPDNANYHYRLGLLLAATQPQAALPYLDTAARLEPSFAPALTAIEDALRTSAYYDDPAYTFLAVGRTLASLNEWELAAEAFRQAIAQNETYGEAWAYLGEALQQLGQDGGQDGSLELSQALSLSPASIAVNMLTALYWQRQGDLDQALAYLDAAAKIEPENPVIQVEIGRTLAAKGDLPLAEAYYRHAIELAPNDPAYHRLLAEFFLQYDIQLHDMALPAARQALLLNPDDPDSLNVMAQVLLRLNDPLTAERFLLQAVTLAPENPSVRLQLGQVYWLRGEFERARQEWQQVLVLSPGSALAQEAQRWLER
jgi:tetratricopeptide (TPR) repeat protein